MLVMPVVVSFKYAFYRLPLPHMVSFTLMNGFFDDFIHVLQQGQILPALRQTGPVPVFHSRIKPGLQGFDYLLHSGYALLGP
jgi:hypothetical protein